MTTATWRLTFVAAVISVMLSDCAGHRSLPTLSSSSSRHANSGITAASGTVPNFVSTHLFVGSNSSDGCYGGTPSSSVFESVSYILEACASTPDPTTICPQYPSPPNGAQGCVPELYTSTTLIYCDIAPQVTWYDKSYTSEANFLHTSSPVSASNRLGGTSSRAHCPAPAGGTTGSDYYYWTDPKNGAWNWMTYYYQTGPIAGRHWVWAFLDNFTIYRPNQSGVGPVEYSTLASWRQALGASAALMSDDDMSNYCTTCTPDGSGPYISEANAFGPGGGNFPSNNGAPPNDGIVNEAVDVYDLCQGVANQTTGVTGLGPGYLPMIESERPWERGNGDRLLAGGNPKIMINTASQFFGNPTSGSSCTGAGVSMLEVLNAADTVTLRMVTKAMEFLMTPDAYSGGWGNTVTYPRNLATPIIEFRYTIGTTQQNPTSAAQEVAIFPEDELVMVNPIQQVGYYKWSGVGDGGGCVGVNTLSSDTGGTHSLAIQRSCGAVGTWDGGYYAPVYFREGTCYRSGQLLGACAAAISMSTSSTSSFLLKQSDFVNGALYHHYLAVIGGELSTDPISHGQICPSSNGNCNGAWGENPLNGSPWTYTLPSCAPPDGATKYENGADCAVILVP